MVNYLECLRQKTQVQSGHNPISLPCPLGKDKSFGAFLPNYRPEESKDQKRQGRRQSIDDQALDASNGRYLGIREQNGRTESFIEGS